MEGSLSPCHRQKEAAWCAYDHNDWGIDKLTHQLCYLCFKMPRRQIRSPQIIMLNDVDVKYCDTTLSYRNQKTRRALASAWFCSRNSALLTSCLEIAWSSKVWSSLSVSLTLAPPPSSCSAISSWLPVHSAAPSTDWPAESFRVRFGITWRLRPLCVTWAEHATEHHQFHCHKGQLDRQIDILFSTITNNNYFKNIVTQWKATRGNTPSKLVAWIYNYHINELYR